MAFSPVRQINTIIRQEYFEPTISWAIRVVLALNVPLIVLPIWKGFSTEVIWAAFGAYMISLIDYKGFHYRKITIQSTAALLFFCSALLGMNIRETLPAAIIAMFFIGMFAALIRNWSDYGPGIGVATGFFFLYGLSNHVSLNESLTHGLYLLSGAVWAIFITLLSFPFRPSDPVKRSVAKVWKANTDFLDTVILQLSDKTNDKKELLYKEVEIRKAIDKSVELFERSSGKQKDYHFNQLIGIRRCASLFAATMASLTEDLSLFDKNELLHLKETLLYKTLSAMSQASARLAIVTFSRNDEDLVIFKARLKRAATAIELLENAVKESAESGNEDKEHSIHFFTKLKSAIGQLKECSDLLEEKRSEKNNIYFENYRLNFNNFIAGFQPDALLAFIKSLGNIDREQILYALRVSIGLCLGVFIYKYFSIDHGYWIPLTMIIVIQPYYGATLKKALQRVSGTVAGILAGGLIMLLPLPHWLFVGLLIIVSFFVAYFLRNNYKIGVFFVTIMMVVMMQLSHQGSWELIGVRILATLIGAAIALISGAILWPVWEREGFRELISESLALNRQYLRAVLNEKMNAGNSVSWTKQRRLAESANSNLFASLQRMYEEPKRIQNNLEHYFGLTGSSIRLTREITAIALSTSDNDVNYESWKANLEKLFTETINVLNNISESSEKHDNERNQQPAGNSYTDKMLEKLSFELNTMIRYENRLADY